MICDSWHDTAVHTWDSPGELGIGTVQRLFLDELSKRGKGGYGEIYFEDLATRAADFLSRRLTLAANDASSYWYTAWTDAQRPELK